MSGDATATAEGYRHEALICDDLDDLVAVAVPFLHEGLERGERVMATVARDAAAAIGDLVGDDVELVDAGERYRRLGAMWHGFHELVSGHPAGGPRLRLLAENPFANAGGPREHEIREYLHYEALCNRVFAPFAVTCLCPYRRHRFDERALDAVACTHPRIRDRSGVTPSDDFRPAAELVADGQRQVGRLDPPAGVPAMPLAGADELAALRATARAHASAQGLTGASVEDLLTAVTEVASNALMHGAEPRAVRMWGQDGRLVVEVRDGGDGLADPLLGYLLPDEGPSGRGLWMARQLCEVLEIGHSAAGTVVRLHAA